MSKSYEDYKNNLKLFCIQIIQVKLIYELKQISELLWDQRNEIPYQ